MIIVEKNEDLIPLIDKIEDNFHIIRKSGYLKDKTALANKLHKIYLDKIVPFQEEYFDKGIEIPEYSDEENELIDIALELYKYTEEIIKEINKSNKK